MRRAVLAFTPLLLWAAVVLFVGGLDIGIDASLPSGSDKAAHFVMYGVGGVLAAWAGRVRGGAVGWLALAFVVATGAVDELHQGIVPARDADFWDWATDVVGAAALYGVARTTLGRDGAG